MKKILALFIFSIAASTVFAQTQEEIDATKKQPITQVKQEIAHGSTELKTLKNPHNSLFSKIKSWVYKHPYLTTAGVVTAIAAIAGGTYIFKTTLRNKRKQRRQQKNEEIVKLTEKNKKLEEYSELLSWCNDTMETIIDAFKKKQPLNNNVNTIYQRQVYELTQLAAELNEYYDLNGEILENIDFIVERLNLAAKDISV